LVYGDFIAFLFGWAIFMIGGSGAIAALAFVFSQSVNTLIHLPEPFSNIQDISIGHFIYPFSSSGIKIFAVLTIFILSWINYRGVKNGGRLNNVVTGAKILGIFMLIVLGFFYTAPTNHDPLPVTVPITVSGFALFSGLFGAILSALWAYDGWANITYVTGEIRNPQKNIPIAIVAGLAIAMALYVLLNASFMKVLSIDQLSAIGQDKIAGAEVAGVIMGKAGTVIIAVLIMISTFGALNGCIITYPRIYYRMAQENVFFKKAANVHPAFRTPYISLIFSSTWSCILVISGTFDLLTNLIVFSGYLFFGFVAWGLVRMKRKGVIKTKVIGYPVFPILIILFALVLVANTAIVETRQSIIGVGLVLSGIPFYYYFKRKNVDT
jgi:APA family basic amino acid/polyamine antiporter